MDLDLFFWILSRVAGISSFIALAISLLTGVALRTAVLDWLGSNRVVKSVHEYTAVLWIPLGVLHIVSLVLDHTARIGLLDLLIPFRAPYGTVSIGLGTLSFEIFRHCRPHRLAEKAPRPPPSGNGSTGCPTSALRSCSCTPCWVEPTSPTRSSRR